MELHFYTSIESVNGILKGDRMLVFTKEGKKEDMVHISIDVEQYDVEKVVSSKHMFRVSKKGLI